MQDRRLGPTSKLNAMPMKFGRKGPSEGTESDYGLPTYSRVGKVDGGYLPIEYRASKFKAQYFDECTGEPLDPKLLRSAMEDELNYFNSKVWK